MATTHGKPYMPICKKLAKFRVTTTHFMLKIDIKATKILFFPLANLTTYVCHELYQKILKQIRKIGTVLIGKCINMFVGHGHL